MPTYLADLTWREIPWQTSSKSPFDQVIDFMLQAPAIFQQGDLLDHLRPPERLLTALRMIDQCWRLDAALEKFHEGLIESVPGPLYWPQFSKVASPADDSDRGKVFPIAFHFPSWKIAITLMFYWSTMLMLWSGLTQLYGLIATIQLDETPDNDSPGIIGNTSDESKIEDDSNYDDDVRSLGSVELVTSRLPLLEHREEYLSLACNICQSVEYCTQDEMVGWGRISVTAPLSIAIEYLRQDPRRGRELSWARAALHRNSKSELRILDYLLKEQNQ